MTGIKNLPDLFENVLGDSKIQNYKIEQLTSPGENYGSFVKKIPTDKENQNSFNIQVTFKNEVAMYKTVIPILQEFQKENGIQDIINCFPKYYCSRFNLNGSEVIDEDGVLVLENLAEQGYKNVDRTQGFNLESTKLILNDLAELHAVPLALKLKKPDTFISLKQYCDDFQFRKEYFRMFKDIQKDIIEENKNLVGLVDRINFVTEVDRAEVIEPMATLVHYDLWCNNSMQKFVGDVAVENKFLDFQFLAYGSPASDLFFFLWTSVELSVLQNHFEDLLIYYHQHFINTLKKLHCDTISFSYKIFLEEIKRQCVFEIGHTLHFILFIVNGKKNRTHEIKFPDDIDQIKNEVTVRAKQQAWCMLEECQKRGWL